MVRRGASSSHSMLAVALALLAMCALPALAAGRLDWLRAADGEGGGGPGPNTCTDSDGGEFPLVFGIVVGYFATNQTPFTKTDRCTSADHLKEVVCTASKDYMEWYEDCGAFGCADGRCLNRALTCADSNPAWSAGGTVSGMTLGGEPYAFADACLSDTVQLDYYCDPTAHQPHSSVGPCRQSEGGTHCIQDHCAP